MVFTLRHSVYPLALPPPDGLGTISVGSNSIASFEAASKNPSGVCPMCSKRLTECLANDRPALFGDATVLRLIGESAEPIPQLLRSARERGESPPEYFFILDRLCERILASCGNERLCGEYDAPLEAAKLELKNTLNFACWDVLDELEAQS